MVGRNKNKLMVLKIINLSKKNHMWFEDKARNKKIWSIVNDEPQIDILINNAGITDDSLFIRMNYENGKMS